MDLLNGEHILFQDISVLIEESRRMMQFAEQFPNFEIVSALPTQLTRSHITEVLPLKTNEAKLFYLNRNAGAHGTV